MPKSNFSFIVDDILRQNLDEAFDHIVTLLPFSESETYNEPAKSAFRKTMIICTASIIEALLLSVLSSSFTDDDIKDHYSTWSLENKKVFYKVSITHEIVGGDYKKVSGKTRKEKMNLGQIADFLKNKKVLSQVLYDKVETIRNLRNDQHIGSHKKVKSYSKGDLEEAFSIAKSIKEFAQKQLP